MPHDTADAVEEWLQAGGEPLEPVEHILFELGNSKISIFVPREGGERWDGDMWWQWSVRASPPPDNDL